jgi:hypothetical protein
VLGDELGHGEGLDVHAVGVVVVEVHCRKKKAGV